MVLLSDAQVTLTSSHSDVPHCVAEEFALLFVTTILTVVPEIVGGLNRGQHSLLVGLPPQQSVCVLHCPSPVGKRYAESESDQLTIQFPFLLKEGHPVGNWSKRWVANARQSSSTALAAVAARIATDNNSSHVNRLLFTMMFSRLEGEGIR